MGYLFAVLTIALYVLYIGLLLRMMFDWVRIFSPTWRPRGPVLVVASAVYGVTDWPMNLLRKVVPPLRLGNVALDMGFFDSYYCGEFFVEWATVSDGYYVVGDTSPIGILKFWT